MADWDSILTALGGTWPARLAQTAIDAAKLPADVYSGRTPIVDEEGRTSEDVIRRASDFAGLATATPGGVGGLGSGIRASAFKYGDKVYTGPVHSDAIEAAAAAHSVDPNELFHMAAKRGNEGMTGFITDAGKFVDRAEALQIAKQNNQLTRVYENQPVLLAQDLLKKYGLAGMLGGGTAASMQAQQAPYFGP